MHDARQRQHQPGREGRAGDHAERHGGRDQCTEVEVGERVDVGHEAGQQLALAATQPPRDERSETLEEADPQPGQLAQRQVVRGQPFAVAQQWPRSRPSARTATITTISSRICGRWAAREIR